MNPLGAALNLDHNWAVRCCTHVHVVGPSTAVNELGGTILSPTSWSIAVIVVEVMFSGYIYPCDPRSKKITEQIHDCTLPWREQSHTWCTCTVTLSQFWGKQFANKIIFLVQHARFVKYLLAQGCTYSHYSWHTWLSLTQAKSAAHVCFWKGELSQAAWAVTCTLV